MWVRLCDRCGKQIGRFDKNGSVTLPKYKVDASEEATRYCAIRPLDFCPECAKFLSDFIEANVHVPEEVLISTDIEKR